MDSFIGIFNCLKIVFFDLPLLKRISTDQPNPLLTLTRSRDHFCVFGKGSGRTEGKTPTYFRTKSIGITEDKINLEILMVSISLPEIDYNILYFHGGNKRQRIN